MSEGHRHTMGPEHDFEPELGLPQALPAGERVLWRGAPDFASTARHVFHVRKLAIYFAVMLALRLGFDLQADAPWATLLTNAALFASLGGSALAVVTGLAWLTARTTAYTLTNKRVVMRVGIVLSVSFNIPLVRVASAALKLHTDGTGKLPLALIAPDKIAYLHLWPHARGWRMARPEPMLLAVPDAQRVATLLGEAWAQMNGHSAETVATVTTPHPPAVAVPVRLNTPWAWAGSLGRALTRVLPRTNRRLPTH